MPLHVIVSRFIFIHSSFKKKEKKIWRKEAKVIQSFKAGWLELQWQYCQRWHLEEGGVTKEGQTLCLKIQVFALRRRRPGRSRPVCLSLLEEGRMLWKSHGSNTEMMSLGFFIYDLSYLEHLLFPKSPFMISWPHLICWPLFCFLK